MSMLHDDQYNTSQTSLYIPPKFILYQELIVSIYHAEGDYIIM